MTQALGSAPPATQARQSTRAPGRRVLVVVADTVDDTTRSSFGHRALFIHKNDLTRASLPADRDSISSALVHVPDVSDAEKSEIASILKHVVDVTRIYHASQHFSYRQMLVQLTEEASRESPPRAWPATVPALDAQPPAHAPATRTEFLARHANLKAPSRKAESLRLMALPGASDFGGSEGAWYQAVNKFFNDKGVPIPARASSMAPLAAGMSYVRPRQAAVTQDEESAMAQRVSHFRSLVTTVRNEMVGLLDTLAGQAEVLHRYQRLLVHENARIAQEAESLKPMAKENAVLKAQLATAGQEMARLKTVADQLRTDNKAMERYKLHAEAIKQALDSIKS